MVASLSGGSVLSILLGSSNGDVHLPLLASLLTSWSGHLAFLLVSRGGLNLKVES